MWLGLQFNNQYDWDNCFEWYNGTCIRYRRIYHWEDGTEYQHLSTATLNNNGYRNRFKLIVESSGEKQIKGVNGNKLQKYACITACEG